MGMALKKKKSKTKSFRVKVPPAKLQGKTLYLRQVVSLRRIFVSFFLQKTWALPTEKDTNLDTVSQTKAEEQCVSDNFQPPGTQEPHSFLEK